MKLELFGGWAVRGSSALELMQHELEGRVRESRIVDGLQDVRAIIFDK